MQTQNQNQESKGMSPLEAGVTSRKISESAVGAHFEEEASLEALAYQYSQAEGSGKAPTKEHWDRAREEIARRWLQAAPSGNASKSPAKASPDDVRVEEAMHLAR